MLQAGAFWHIQVADCNCDIMRSVCALKAPPLAATWRVCGVLRNKAAARPPTGKAGGHKMALTMRRSMPRPVRRTLRA
eukprot:366217-Chlamydomonas_euryale.AAC.17